MVVEPKIAIAMVLADLNLAVRYYYTSKKYWQTLILQLYRQTTKLPNFLFITKFSGYVVYVFFFLVRHVKDAAILGLDLFREMFHGMVL